MSGYKAPSNIGRRRQPAPRTKSSHQEDQFNDPLKPVGAKSAARTNISRASRAQQLKRQGLIQTQYVGSNVEGSGYGNADEAKENQHPLVMGSSSGTGNQPMFLISPDMDILPVIKTPQARRAFDFYVKSYVTNIIEVSPDNMTMYSQLVHQVLHDELLFTAFTTTSEAARWRTQSLYDDPPPNVSQGYGKTLSLLMKRLASERFAMSPTILLTMAQLVAIETMIKNVSATARHLAGMQAAMKARAPQGAIQSKQPVAAAVDIWTKYMMIRQAIKSGVPRTEALTYPRHPFPPSLTEQIIELPSGFEDVCLSGRLSLPMLDLLNRFNGYFRKYAAHHSQGTVGDDESINNILHQTAYCVEYHQLQRLTVLERLILVTLTAYVVRRDRIPPGLVNMRNYFQITCAYQVKLLGQSDNGLTEEDWESDMFVWAGLMLLLTSSPHAHARDLALKLLPSRPEPLKILKKCEQFFWDDDLTNALLTGNVLLNAASNDVVADNYKQALQDAEPEQETADSD